LSVHESPFGQTKRSKEDESWYAPVKVNHSHFHDMFRVNNVKNIKTMSLPQLEIYGHSKQTNTQTKNKRIKNNSEPLARKHST